MRTFVVTLVTAVLAAGCTLPRQNNMPSEEDLVAMAHKLPTEDDIRERFRAVAGVLREICTAPEFSPYFAKTPCLATMATRRQLNDRTKITAREKAAMIAAHEEIDALNAETRRIMIESQIEPYVELAQQAQSLTEPVVRANRKRLMDGTITWGQYNRNRLSIAQNLSEHRKAFDEALEEEPTEVSASKEKDSRQ